MTYNAFYNRSFKIITIYLLSAFFTSAKSASDLFSTINTFNFLNQVYMSISVVALIFKYLKIVYNIIESIFIYVMYNASRFEILNPFDFDKMGGIRVMYSEPFFHNKAMIQNFTT